MPRTLEELEADLEQWQMKAAQHETRLDNSSSAMEALTARMATMDESGATLDRAGESLVGLQMLSEKHADLLRQAHEKITSLEAKLSATPAPVPDPDPDPAPLPLKKPAASLRRPDRAKTRSGLELI